MTARQYAAIGALLLVLMVLCAIVSTVIRGDPFAGVELGVALVVGTWLTLLAREAVQGFRLARALTAHSEPAEFDGLTYRVAPLLGRAAIVVGLARPSIFVGPMLLAQLEPDELAAVLRHEDHHRAARAPLRAAALLAWRTVLVKIPFAREHVDDRLAELEILADDAAIRRGSHPAAILRALLKTDRSTVRAPSFNSGVETRVRALVDQAEGSHRARSLAVPMEWLALLLVAIAIGCHL